MKCRRVGLVVGLLGISIFALYCLILGVGSIDWFIDEPNRGETLLTCITLGMAVTGIWLGRKCLLLAGPCVLAFLLIAANAIPGAMPARNVSQRAACINNLQFIANAKNDWARENHKLPTDVPTRDDLYGTNKFLRHTPVCPRGGIYTIGRVSENPTCSFTDKGHELTNSVSPHGAPQPMQQ
jgi:hypothetical protein